MSDGPTPEELHAAIDRTVEELLHAAGLTSPPIDLARLARFLGMPPGEPTPRRGRAAAVARGDPGPDGQAWLRAHAIGRWLLADVLSRLDLAPNEPGPLGGGSLANLTADRLLVPTRWLKGLGRELGWDLLALEERFRPASHERIAWRMLDLEEPVVITVIDNDHVARRQSNAVRVTKTLADPEERCRQMVHRYSRPHELREGGWRVQGWPVHTVDWRREILRSECEEG